MIPLSPALFITAASSWIPRDTSCAGGLHDNALDPLERDDHRPTDGRETAAFIGQIGYWSHRHELGQSIWPFALDADCDTLAHTSADRGVLAIDCPDPGAILLRWSALEGRFTRASIVLEARDCPAPGQWTFDCDVIEGAVIRDADARPGMPDGQVQWVRRARRRACPLLGDRFISWVDLDGRNRFAQVA